MTDPLPSPEPGRSPHLQQRLQLRHPNLLLRSVVAAAALVVLLTAGFLLQDSALDLPVVQAFNELHVGWLAQVTTVVYFLLDPPGAMTLSALIAVAIFLVRLRAGWRPALITAGTYAATVAIAWLPITVFKSIFARPRPEFAALPHPFVEPQGNTSFPSGHTAFAIITVVVLFLVVATSHTARAVTVILGTCGVAMVIFIVLSNGVHFPTDSAGSLVWGLCFTPLIAGVLQRGATRLAV